MTEWLAALRGFAPIIFGLILGTLAKYGLALDQDERIEPRKVLGHLMMLGLLGLIADAATHLVGAFAKVGEIARILSGASAALLSGRLVRAWRRWAADQADTRLPGNEDRP